MYLEQEDDLSLVAGVVEADGGAHGLAQRLLVHPTDVAALQGHEVDGVEQPTLRLGKRGRRAGSGAGVGQTCIGLGIRHSYEASGTAHRRTTTLRNPPLGQMNQASGVQVYAATRCVGYGGLGVGLRTMYWQTREATAVLPMPGRPRMVMQRLPCDVRLSRLTT